MEKLESTCASLRAQITATETRLAGLRRELESAEKAAIDIRKEEATEAEAENKDHKARTWPLLGEEYRRYGRQMIVPQLGLQGASTRNQLKPHALSNNNPLCCRSIEASILEGLDSWCRWIGMSGCAVSSRSRSWHIGTGRRRYGRVFEPPSPGSTSEENCWEVQGG